MKQVNMVIADKGSNVHVVHRFHLLPFHILIPISIQGIGGFVIGETKSPRSL